MVLVQDLARPADVDRRRRSACSRAGSRSSRGRCRSCRARARPAGCRQPGQLALRLAPRLLGQAGLLDPAAELGRSRCRRSSSSPSSRWMDRSCSRRKYSRCFFESRSSVSVVIFRPSSRTATSRCSSRPAGAASPRPGPARGAPGARPVDGHHRRDEVRHLPRIGDVLGGRRQLVRQLGDASTSRRKMPTTARRRPSTSAAWTAGSGAASTRATRYGSVPTQSSSRIRSMPWTIRRTLPSGIRAS